MSPTAIPGNLLLKNGMVITGEQKYPAVIGEPFGGGYFAGYISHTADGNPTHALIVAPRATGQQAGLSWKTTNTATAGTGSLFDGAANTAAMVAAGITDHPAAQFCKNLNIGGYTDWYLPAHLENQIAYFNLKPTTASNNTNTGINAYAVPPLSRNYTLNYPIQTSVDLFKAGGSESFTTTFFWASTEGSSTNAYSMEFATGLSYSFIQKSRTDINVRAFRRIAL